jgi:poly-gamma-glutamate synthesis protein (capsule biosynthesis protein)
MNNPTIHPSINFKKYILSSIGFALASISFITFFLLVIFTGSPANSSHSKYDNSPLVVNDSFERITIIAAGDAMSHMQIVASAWDTSCKCYNYSDDFKYLHTILKNSDLAFINYETTNGGKPYSGFPKFSGPDTLAWFLKSAGFNFFVNANNHSIDKGLGGITRTLDVFDKFKINHTGVFRDTNERKKTYPVILRQKGFKLAILNYTYGTNNIETPAPAFVNRIDTVLIKGDLENALDSMPDAVLVLMHWGVEYQSEPNFEQKKLADFLFRNGADAIIGSHPHVIQPIELVNFSYKGKHKTGLVIWSLGNFVANQRKRFCDGGIFARFAIARNIYTRKIKIDKISYIPFWVYKQTAPIKYYVLPISMFENDSTTFNMTQEDKLSFKTFINDTRLYLAMDTANVKESKIQ